ncbi:PREDICTED: heavy metal-associated isoprenylated plant protein 13-like [Ipomoea nil]|uniref:heavy metal-associated isoprenylated plant protein 13-like n=1 Tax=Ipomoea nil TaxID=35883 RepID=UPI000901625D|nr:PREDICTED: heavy metal-associated isoprenylated plant protein 13-like [Ipomoea nil]
MMKIVLKLENLDDKIAQKVMKKVSELYGVESMSVDKNKKLLTVTGIIDPVLLVAKLRKVCNTEIVSAGPKEGEKKKGDDNNKGADEKKGEDGKKKGAGGGAQAAGAAAQPFVYYPPYPYQQQYHYYQQQYPPSAPPPYYNSYRAVDDTSHGGCVIS